MNNHNFSNPQKRFMRNSSPSIPLEEGARVAVMGGGPAGSLFTFFLLDMAQRIDLSLQVDIYEPRDFSLPGPAGCNMCAGIISESVIQMLALEGINIPSHVVQRGMDTYSLHTDVGRAHLKTPQLEKRIATVFRGAGPLGITDNEWSSFDGFLLDIALGMGANLIPDRVEKVDHSTELVQVKPRRGMPLPYDLLVVATGINSGILRMFPKIVAGYQPPKMAQTFVREYFLGKDLIDAHLGTHTIHFFLLNLPGMDFAAIVPKGNYVTVCLLGKDISKEVVESFLNSAPVKKCMPPGWQPDEFACHCSPRINLRGAIHPYADRMIFLGDSAVSRLYKDGIGAAYRAAKVAAAAVIFHGIGAADLKRVFWPSFQSMEFDNLVGKIIFTLVSVVKPHGWVMRGMLSQVEKEQMIRSDQRLMSRILWDMFTGSASYRDIFGRFFHPIFWSSFIWLTGLSLLHRRSERKQVN
jgi:flavin-dependent dehydrogenase